MALLNLEEAIEIAGQAVNGREAVDMVRKESPDVVLMDLAMPVMNGLQATRHYGLRRFEVDSQISSD